MKRHRPVPRTARLLALALVLPLVGLAADGLAQPGWDPDQLESGLLGPADELESGLLGPADELETGLIGLDDPIFFEPPPVVVARPLDPWTLEPGVLGPADGREQLEHGLIGLDDPIFW